MRVLIVDDDKFMRRLIRVNLDQEGFECFEAQDGIEALALARETHPRVILLDVMLPGMDGYKVCRMLKFDENFADVAVIMVTSRDKPGDAETGYETGADAYITKPFKAEDLLETIKRVVGSPSSSEPNQ
jgi:two-component system alkaline phosphatase synthesis response regulator PhoP